MKRLLVLTALLAFAWWRRHRFDEHDRVHAFGAYSDLPAPDPA